MAYLFTNTGTYGGLSNYWNGLGRGGRGGGGAPRAPRAPAPRAPAPRAPAPRAPAPKAFFRPARLTPKPLAKLPPKALAKLRAKWLPPAGPVTEEAPPADTATTAPAAYPYAPGLLYPPGLYPGGAPPTLPSGRPMTPARPGINPAAAAAAAALAAGLLLF